MNAIFVTIAQSSSSFETGSLVYALVAVAALWIALEIIGSFAPKSEGGDSCCCSGKQEVEEKHSCCQSSASTSATGTTSDDSEEQIHAAVIAAAVATVLGKSYRITSISYADDLSTAWSREGRREIYSSHRIR